MALVENHPYHLEELDGSDFEIIDHEPNIIGWDVKNEEGIVLGEVKNLLFDRHSRQVRYIVLDLDGNQLHMDEDREVLIPIGIAELYRKDKEKNKKNAVHDNRVYYPGEDGNVVILSDVTAQHLNALPLYEKDHLSPHIEHAIRNIFARRNRVESPYVSNDYNKDEFYQHEDFNETKFYNRRKDDE